VSEGRFARPNRVTPARVRAEIDALAAAGDIAGLRHLGQSLPPLLAYTYERRRAAALALALEGNLDAALSEHALGRAAHGIAPDTVAADAALLRSLARGEPAAAGPGFDLRPLYGVAAVAATIALTVGVTLRLVAVDPGLPALEAPPEHADTFVRVPRSAPARPDDRAAATPRPASTRGTSTVSVVTGTLPQSERLRALRRSRPAPQSPTPATNRPRPTAPPPAPPPPAQPAPAPPPPEAAPAAPEPAAEVTPPQRAAPAPPPPEQPKKPGRRRGQDKQEKQAKKAPAPESPPVVAAEPQPAPAEQPQPAADEGHGPPEHANNDKDKEPKDKPEKEK
jgi:hypothetical protein